MKTTLFFSILLALSFPLAGCESASMAAMSIAANSKPLNLYGQVLDQYGNPISGVKVTGGTLLVTGFDRSGGRGFQTETDAQGRFDVHTHGVDLGVTFEKEGYYWEGKFSAQRPENYYTSDSSHPVIFPMWKLQGAEPMVQAKFGGWIPYDGTPVGINLFTGKKDATGDLRITLVRNPVQLARRSDHFDWNVKMEIVGGGLVASHDPYPYEAPENSYQPEFEFSQAMSAPVWTRKLTQVFYVRTPKGNYGRILVDLTTDSDHPEGTGLEIEAYMNPSGSRNLEWDSAKEIKPGAK